MKNIKIVFLFFLLNTILSAEQLNIINMHVGKIIALGSEFSVVDNGLLNTITNPSLLSKLKKKNFIEFNKVIYFAQTSYDLISIAGKDISQDNTFGLTVGRFSSGNIDVLNLRGEKTGETAEYSITSINFSIASKVFKNVYGGIGVFGLWEKINVDSKYFGSNIGFLFNPISTNIYKLNLGSVLKGVGVNQNLSINIGMLFGYRNLNIIFGYETFLQNIKNEKIKFGLNVNIWGSEVTSNNIYFNIGGYQTIKQGFVNYGSGFGMRLEPFVVDFSYSHHNILGDIQNINFGLKL